MTKNLRELEIGEEIEIIYRGRKYPSVYLGYFVTKDALHRRIFLTKERGIEMMMIFSLDTFSIGSTNLKIPSMNGRSIVSKKNDMYNYYLERINRGL